MLNERQRERVSIPFFFIDMVLFGLAMGFLDSSTVIPEFVGRATDSQVLVGLSGIMFTLFWRLPQLAFAPAANRTPNKRLWMFKGAMPGRISFFFVALAAFTVGRTNPGLMLAVFFIALGSFAMLDGIISLVWVELIGSAVPDKTRGIMLSASQVVYGFLILGVQSILRQILDEKSSYGLTYPHNYAVVFTIAAVLMTTSIFLLCNVAERKDGPKARNIELRDYLPFLTTMIRTDHPFRNFLIMRFFTDAAFFMVTPFYIGFETNVLHINPAQAVSDSLIAVMFGNIGGSLMSGWLSTRFSPRMIIWMMIGGVIIGPSLVLVSPALGYPAVLLSFVTIGLVHATSAPGLMNWLIAYPAPGNRPVYSGIANTIGIVALLAPVIGGVIVQVSGYVLLYIVALVLAFAAAGFSARLVSPNAQLHATGAEAVP